jgi:hypothetical protein
MDVKAHAKAIEDLQSNFAKPALKTAATSSRLLPNDLDFTSEAKTTQAKQAAQESKQDQSEQQFMTSFELNNRRSFLCVSCGKKNSKSVRDTLKALQKHIDFLEE